MKKLTRNLLICLLLCLVAAGSIYTQPKTLGERYSTLDLSKCTQIRGTWQYSDERLDAGERQEFELKPGDEDFDELIELLQKTEFRNQLVNFIPRGKGAVNYHTPEAGDFQWDVWLEFDEPVLMADGNSAKGSLLSISNFYGRLTLDGIDGEAVLCEAADHEAWLAEVFELISVKEG